MAKLFQLTTSTDQFEKIDDQLLLVRRQTDEGQVYYILDSSQFPACLGAPYCLQPLRSEIDITYIEVVTNPILNVQLANEQQILARVVVINDKYWLHPILAYEGWRRIIGCQCNDYCFILTHDEQYHFGLERLKDGQLLTIINNSDTYFNHTLNLIISYLQQGVPKMAGVDLEIVRYDYQDQRLDYDQLLLAKVESPSKELIFYRCLQILAEALFIIPKSNDAQQLILTFYLQTYRFDYPHFEAYLRFQPNLKMEHNVATGVTQKLSMLTNIRLYSCNLDYHLLLSRQMYEVVYNRQNQVVMDFETIDQQRQFLIYCQTHIRSRQRHKYIFFESGSCILRAVKMLWRNYVVVMVKSITTTAKYRQRHNIVSIELYDPSTKQLVGSVALNNYLVSIVPVNTALTDLYYDQLAALDLTTASNQTIEEEFGNIKNHVLMQGHLTIEIGMNYPLCVINLPGSSDYLISNFITKQSQLVQLEAGLRYIISGALIFFRAAEDYRIIRHIFYLGQYDIRLVPYLLPYEQRERLTQVSTSMRAMAVPNELIEYVQELSL